MIGSDEIAIHVSSGTLLATEVTIPAGGGPLHNVRNESDAPARAYVVFSRTLNENLEVGAIEGSYASVIGGAPAAAVVFAGEVERRTREDGRLEELDRQIADADEAARGRLRARWHELYEQIRSEKLGEVADEFDRVHSVQRAQKVGSVHEILPAERLRPYLIEAVERGMARVRGA